MSRMQSANKIPNGNGIFCNLERMKMLNDTSNMIASPSQNFSKKPAKNKAHPKIALSCGIDFFETDIHYFAFILLFFLPRLEQHSESSFTIFSLDFSRFWDDSNNVLEMRQMFFVLCKNLENRRSLLFCHT